MTIEEYIQSAPEERRDVLQKIREICLENLPGYDETLRYNMPSYELDGEVEIAFASQNKYISFYLLKEPVMDAYRDNFPRSRIGKGCVRYPNPNKIDFALLEQMVQDSFDSDAPIC
jgi:uncharacterized protein YdhG (YjbR/CyaY superfamily)